MFDSYRNSYLLFVFPLLIFACTDSLDPGQVAARVNGEEITVHQINFEVERIPRIVKDANARTKMAAERVLNDVLLAQVSKEKQMHRQPLVLQAMEAAKLRVLAEAYTNSVFEQISTPSPEQLHQYYEAHPELFSGRKIYQYEELLVKVTDVESSLVLKKLIEKSSSLNDLVTQLSKQSIVYAKRDMVQPAEQISFSRLAKLYSLKENALIHFVENDVIHVIELLTARKRPISEKNAQLYIQKFLINELKKQATRKQQAGNKEEANT